MKRNTPSRLVRFWRWARPMVLVIVVLCAFRSSVADWNDVPTGSMRPSILEGDRIFVNKLAYDLKVPFTQWRIAEWSHPRRGDIVVFHCPQGGTRMVKRVIGLPGDTLQMRNNRLVINDQAVEYETSGQGMRPSMVERLDGRSHPITITPSIQAMRSFGPTTVPPGQYFVMGDNRDNSRDSRYFGPVPRECIVGRAPAVVISLDRDVYYCPRATRFFRSLP